jgi:hypothetical protein
MKERNYCCYVAIQSMFRSTKMNVSPASAISILRNGDQERARLKEMSLKWARISREKAKEDASTQNAARADVPATRAA